MGASPSKVAPTPPSSEPIIQECSGIGSFGVFLKANQLDEFLGKLPESQAIQTKLREISSNKTIGAKLFLNSPNAFAQELAMLSNVKGIKGDNFYFKKGDHLDLTPTSFKFKDVERGVTRSKKEVKYIGFLFMEVLTSIEDYIEGGKTLDFNSTYNALISEINALHGNGIYHCDIKPDNICVDANGTACLVDYGVSVGGPTDLPPITTPFITSPLTFYLNWVKATTEETKTAFATVITNLDDRVIQSQQIPIQHYLTGKGKRQLVYQKFELDKEFDQEFNFHAFINDKGGDPIFDVECSQFYRMLALYTFWQNKQKYLQLPLAHKMKHNDYYALGISLAELFSFPIPTISSSSHELIQKINMATVVSQLSASDPLFIYKTPHEDTFTKVTNPADLYPLLDKTIQDITDNNTYDVGFWDDKQDIIVKLVEPDVMVLTKRLIGGGKDKIKILKRWRKVYNGKYIIYEGNRLTIKQAQKLEKKLATRRR
jgi:serine/threonine protein kinase